MDSDDAHGVASKLMMFFIAMCFLTVGTMLTADQDQCLSWDEGTSSQAWDDVCIERGDDYSSAIRWAAFASVSFSLSMLFFLYSMSSKLQESSIDENE